MLRAMQHDDGPEKWRAILLMLLGFGVLVIFLGGVYFLSSP